jgi:NAD(P)-dependent dehydrogenase (short-subunit alcohol dehydrogenase family)
MTDKQVWLITGAGRGMGIDIARAALAAGHAVVGTARNAASVTDALGEHDDLLAVALDVTDPTAAEAAVAASIDRFGHLDVLVNNAGSFYAGFFEEMTPEDFRAQIETTLFGPVNVTRAVLPQMRAQRAGLVVTISSTAGIASTGDFLTAYAASKFGVEGFIEGLATEVAPFGIKTMLVEPGCHCPGVAGHGRQAGRGPRQARPGTRPAPRPRRAAPALRRRRRRRPALRDQGTDPARPGQRPPGAVLQPRPRRRLSARTR